MTELLPKGWAKTSLGAVLRLNYGKALPEPQRRPGGVEVYGSNGMVGLHDAAITSAPCILVGRKGSIGEVHFSAKPCWPIDTTYYVERFDAVEPLFAWWLLKALPLREMNRASAIPGLNREEAYAIPVRVPPLNEQRRIVAKLEALQARSRRARAALDAVPPLHEKLRQSILAAAFRGDLTKDWRAKQKDVEPASKLLERIRAKRRKKWEEAELAKMKAKGKAPKGDEWKSKYKEPEPVDEKGLPELPEGWCWATASDACDQVVDCHNKTAPYTMSGVPLIRTTNIRNGHIDLADTKFVDEPTYMFWSRRCPPQPGDVVFTREAPMGEAGMVPPDTRLCLGQRMMLLRADGIHLRRSYLLLAVQAPYVTTYASRLSVGTGVQHLRVGDVEALPVPLAPSAEQEAVEDAVDAVLARYSATTAVASDLLDAFDSFERSMVAKAFRGELVPQDPNDEPAEVTLARLRGATTPMPERARGNPTRARRMRREEAL